MLSSPASQRAPSSSTEPPGNSHEPTPPMPVTHVEAEDSPMVLTAQPRHGDEVMWSTVAVERPFSDPAELTAAIRFFILFDYIVECLKRM